MKKKTVFGVVLLALLVLQAQTVFAADYDADFLKEVGKNNFSGMERILQKRANQMNLGWCASQVFEGRVSGLSENNIIPVLELLRRYGAVYNNTLWNALERRVSDNIIIYLIDNSTFSSNSYALSDAFWYNRSDAIIQRLIDKGVKPAFNTIRLAIQNRRFNWVNPLILLGGDVNANENNTFERQVGIELGQTPLIIASNLGNFEIVRLLVENGARINLRDEKGRTAASLAYDKGEMEIYNYLKANGAVDFEPRQVAQPATPAPATPSSTTNVYVQPSAPAQSAPAPSTPTLQTGRYAWSNSGTNMNMTFNVGMVTAYINNSPIGVWHGTYRINGSQLVITVSAATGDYASMRGRTFSYNITSSTSFSGSGETWVRIGN